MNVGEIKDEWIQFNPDKEISKGGLVHIKYQLTFPGKIPFIKDDSFIKRILNIKIIEAKEIKAMNMNGFSDPYCQMSLLGDRTFLTTSERKETLSPYWDENFSFLIGNYDKDIFVLSLRNKNMIKADDDIGTVELQINKFQISKVYKKWVEISKKGKKTGLIKVLINVANELDKPFEGEIIEDKVPLFPSEKWEINIQILIEVKKCLLAKIILVKQ